MLHNPSYRPSLQLHHETATYSRACRDVERGLAEWYGPFLARIPRAPEVPKRSKKSGNLLYRCPVCGGGDRRRLCARCRLDGIKGHEDNNLAATDQRYEHNLDPSNELARPSGKHVTKSAEVGGLQYQTRIFEGRKQGWPIINRLEKSGGQVRSFYRIDFDALRKSGRSDLLALVFPSEYPKGAPISAPLPVQGSLELSAEGGR
jgi:hypothetical protein